MNALQRLFGPGLVVTNVGVLIGLIFGPNSGHGNTALLYVGISLVALGLVAMAAAGYSRRRKPSAAAPDR